VNAPALGGVASLVLSAAGTAALTALGTRNTATCAVLMRHAGVLGGLLLGCLMLSAAGRARRTT
jgi:hypothetical protein